MSAFCLLPSIYLYLWRFGKVLTCTFFLNIPVQFSIQNSDPSRKGCNIFSKVFWQIYNKQFLEYGEIFYFNSCRFYEASTFWKLFFMPRRCGENFTSKGEQESLRVVDRSKNNFTSFGWNHFRVSCTGMNNSKTHFTIFIKILNTCPVFLF